MITILGWACIAVLLPVSLLALYQWALAVASILPGRSREGGSRGKQSRFLVLIPAHNEEFELPHTLKSLAGLRYPRHLMHIAVIADRCEDRTAAIARKNRVRVLERRIGPPGKGATIAWAVGELRRDVAEFDAIVILDADTVADPGLLEEFNDSLVSGDQVQQAYNDVSNPWESPFTRLIAVTSTLRNRLFYTGKSRLGLSGMLMGTGMCLSRQVIERHGWTAFSVGEDWEFSVSLLLSGERIHFNPMARVFARESRGFQQASTQRLRWASGRYAVAFTSVWRLLVGGVRLDRPSLWDAALTLLAPNYSTQATLAIFALATAWALSGDPTWDFLLVWTGLVLGSLGVYFSLGVVFSGAPLRTLVGAVLIPVFLPWRMTIEVLGFLGYGRKRWLSTARSRVPRQGTEP